jgi:hypothetical protein
MRGAWAAAAWWLAACSHGAALAICPTDAPAALDPGTDAHLALVAHGRGVQTYACDGKTWSLVAPRAELTDDRGNHLGTHGAGPSWTLADGSRVTGTKLASQLEDPGAVPWLLVGADGHGGRGALDDVTRVQRLHTTGGVAPTSGCDDAHRGSTIDVPYAADYYFYTTARGARCGHRM